MLSFENYSIFAEEKEIIKKLNFSFEKGKIYVIMGPNGSGKSTWASSALGDPKFSWGENSRISFNGSDISTLKTEKRVQQGLFLTLQNPPSLSGVNVFQILRVALRDRYTPLDVRKKISSVAKRLELSEELLSRSLNEGFSGGERKKMEVLQLALFDPICIFLDEIDTGVDVDSLRIMGNFLRDFKTPEKTYIVITHSNRILDFLTPETVIVMKNGIIVQTGDSDLARNIEKNGYENIH